MRRRLLVLALAMAGGAGPAQPAAPADAALVARGAYLARIGGCVSCHTAAEHGIALAGGRAVASPMGPIISTNITPDPVRGIGGYRYEDFVAVMRQGVAPGPRPLYPAMPYAAYARTSDADLRALFHYLMHGVAPSDHAPPPTRLPFPFDQRWALRVWQWLFVPRQPFVARPDRDASWNRGAYLVQGFGHCGSCHTPRGVAFQERGNDESSPLFLTGMVLDHWYASNLTADPGAGLGRMPEAAVAQFLRTGHAGGSVAFGSMAQEIEESLQYLTPADAEAVARYLKSLPAQRQQGQYRPDEWRPVQPPDARPELALPGEQVYRAFCASCHRTDGRGQPPTIPALAGNPSLLSDDSTSLVRLVVQGGRGPATADGPTPMAMPGHAGTLTDVQMAAVLTYARSAWGNRARAVSTQNVASTRKQLGP